MKSFSGALNGSFESTVSTVDSFVIRFKLLFHFFYDAAMFPHNGPNDVSAFAGIFPGGMQSIDIKEDLQRLHREGRYIALR